MDEVTHPSCDRCGVTVPRNLVRFHNLWHESQNGRTSHFFDDQDVHPEVVQLLAVVAALRAVPPVTARTEFVTALRERLMTRSRHRTSASVLRSASAATSHPDVD